MLIFKRSFDLTVKVRSGHNFTDYIAQLEHENSAFTMFAAGYTAAGAVANLEKTIESTIARLDDAPDNAHNRSLRTYLESLVEVVPDGT